MKSSKEKEALLDADTARRLLSYNPKTGEFTWRVRDPVSRGAKIFNTRFAGKKAGKILPDGYKYLSLYGKSFSAHRVAWLIMTGGWPDGFLDHINGERYDNKWINLRPASKTQNSANSKRPITNTTGFKGVCVDKGRFKANIRENGNKKHLGCFDTPEEAHEAYCKAAEDIHGEFARAE